LNKTGFCGIDLPHLIRAPSKEFDPGVLMNFDGEGE